MESVLIYSLFALVAAVALARHLRRTRRREEAALEAARRSGRAEGQPRAQHPHIDISRCIGCAACVDACPEGLVLGVIGGKAAIVAAEKCIGHGLCAEACPVGRISQTKLVRGASSFMAAFGTGTPAAKSLTSRSRTGRIGDPSLNGPKCGTQCALGSSESWAGSPLSSGNANS